MHAFDGRLRDIPSTLRHVRTEATVGQPETSSYRISRSFDAGSHVEEGVILGV